MVRYFGTQIQLPSDPAGIMQAVTKQYADAGDLDAARRPTYPMDQSGFVALTMPIECIALAQSVSVNTIEICRIYVPANKAITGAAINVATAGTTPGSSNASGFALYSDDGSSQLAITTNDYTLFTTAGWRSKAFNASVAAQSTGRFLRVAFIHTCSVTPKFGASVSTASSTWNFIVPSGTHRRQVFATSTLTFPASFTASTFGTLDNPLLCMGLY